MNGRIWFENNPWPKGHAIRTFSFSILLHEQGAGLMLHMKTQAYQEEYPDDADMPGSDDDFDEVSGLIDDDPLRDWKSPVVWNNFNAAILSNTHWGYSPLILPPMMAEGARLDARLAGFHTVAVDPIGRARHDSFDPDHNAFQIYLLGHDAVRDHQILIEKDPETRLFRIEWSGKIALTYSGDPHYRHRFRAFIEDAPFEGFRIDNPRPVTRHDRISAAAKPQPPEPNVRKARADKLAQTHLRNADALEFVCGKGFKADFLKLG